MKKKLLAFIIFIISMNLYGQDCDQLLKNVYNYYNARNESSLIDKFDYLFSMDQSKLNKNKMSTSSGFNIPIPVIDSVINIGFSNEADRIRYESIRSSMINTSSREVIKDNLDWLITKTVSKDILDAWIKCIENKTSSGLNIKGKIINPTTLQITLSWLPSSKYLPDDIQVDSILLSNISLSHSTDLSIGTNLTLGSKSFLANKLTDGSTLIVVHFKDIGEVQYFLSKEDWDEVFPPSNIIEGFWKIIEVKYEKRQNSIAFNRVFPPGTSIYFRKKNNSNSYISNLEQNYPEEYQIKNGSIMRVIDINTKLTLITRDSVEGSNGTLQHYGSYIINNDQLFIFIDALCKITLQRE